MSPSKKSPYGLTYFLQVFSISLIWVLVVSVITWILNLISLSHYLHDAQNATLAISLVVLPIFTLLASVLTYVFFGLRRAGKHD